MVIGAVALALTLGVTVVWSMVSRPPVDQRAWILLADLENITADSVFNRALNAALFSGLQQSDYVNVFPRMRIQQALARMGVTGTQLRAPFDEARALEVARREEFAPSSPARFTQWTART